MGLQIRKPEVMGSELMSRNVVKAKEYQCPRSKDSSAPAPGKLHFNLHVVLWSPRDLKPIDTNCCESKSIEARECGLKKENSGIKLKG